MDLAVGRAPDDRVLTHAGLLTAGYSAHEIRRARAVGDLAPLVRGSYGSGPRYRDSSPEKQHVLLARSRVQDSPSVVLSHASAAIFHGLPLPRDAMDMVHVTRPGRGGWRRTAGVHQHTGMLAESDVQVIDGITVTSLARTLVDLARFRSFQESVIAADAAFRQSPAAVLRIPEILARARHLNGVGRARRALAFADGRSESPGETRTRMMLHDLGLPDPELQCEIFDARGSFVGRVDLAIPGHGVLIEFDGMVKYGDLLRGKLTPQQVLAKEKHREDALRELGWLVVRVTWSDLDDAVQLAGRLRTALARGRRVMDVSGLDGTIRRSAPIRITAA